MKKIKISGLALVLSMSLAACNSKSNEMNDSLTETGINKNGISGTDLSRIDTTTLTEPMPPADTAQKL